MRIKKSLASAGTIDFPVLPAILVAVLLLMILGGQFLRSTSFVVGGYKLEDADVQSTSIRSRADNNMVDLTLNLTPNGASRLAGWAADHPDTELSITVGGTYLGDIKLTPGINTHSLTIVSKTGAAVSTRLSLGR